MRRGHFIFCIAICGIMVMTGCRKRPDSVLSESKTADVLADLQLAEAYMDMHRTEFATEESRRALKLRILKDNNVSEAELSGTLDWYGHNMELYSRLYDDVAKRLEKRKSKIDGSETSPANFEDNVPSLWPYSPMTMFSQLTKSSGLRFSIAPQLENGDRLEWNLRFSTPVSTDVMIGVDYKEGGNSILQRSYGGSRNVKIKLQTDSSRQVKRAYGVIKITNNNLLPIWADSISLIKTPLVAEEYSTYNYQHNLHPPGKNQYRRQPINSIPVKNNPEENHSNTGHPKSEVTEKAPEGSPTGMAPSAGGMRPGNATVTGIRR